MLKVSYTETYKQIGQQYLPYGGGIPEIDFGLLDTEDGVTFGALLDPNLVQNHSCFLGKFVLPMDDGETAMSLLFTYFTANMLWCGYNRVIVEGSIIEVSGSVIASGIGSVQITLNMPTA